MAQKGRKKPSEETQRDEKGPSRPRPSPEAERADWSPGEGAVREEESSVPEDAAVQGEEDLILDVDPVLERTDRAREFSPSENPFVEDEEDRLPREDPVSLHPPQEEDMDLEEPTTGGRPKPRERIVPYREHEGEPPPILPGSSFLDALFLDFPFPARKEDVACHLAQEAHAHGGPAPAFHDLVVQLDQLSFKDIQDLKLALGDRFAWEAAHDRPRGSEGRPGGFHG